MSGVSGEQQIQIKVRERASAYPCLILVRPLPDTRVVRMESGAVRVAFVATEIQLIAKLMRRIHRAFGDIPAITDDQNVKYVPGAHGRPFLAALVAESGAVRIGLEISETDGHPVVELSDNGSSRVRITASAVGWTPTWTEFRTLVAEFYVQALEP